MVHILGSAFFMLVALASLAVIVAMLAEARAEIAMALGFGEQTVRRAPRHAVRVRSAGRWQAAMRVPAQAQKRAAA